jgi:hypothetical protein
VAGWRRACPAVPCSKGRDKRERLGNGIEEMRETDGEGRGERDREGRECDW